MPCICQPWPEAQAAKHLGKKAIAPSRSFSPDQDTLFCEPFLLGILGLFVSLVVVSP